MDLRYKVYGYDKYARYQINKNTSMYTFSKLPLAIPMHFGVYFEWWKNVTGVVIVLKLGIRIRMT